MRHGDVTPTTPSKQPPLAEVKIPGRSSACQHSLSARSRGSAGTLISRARARASESSSKAAAAARHLRRVRPLPPRAPPRASWENSRSASAWHRTVVTASALERPGPGTNKPVARARHPNDRDHGARRSGDGAVCCSRGPWTRRASLARHGRRDQTAGSCRGQHRLSVRARIEPLVSGAATRTVCGQVTGRSAGRSERDSEKVQGSGLLTLPSSESGRRQAGGFQGCTRIARIQCLALGTLDVSGLRSGRPQRWGPGDGASGA